MFLGEVCVLHGGLEISVAHRLLHMDGVFLLGQPSGDAAVPKIMLSEAWWRSCLRTSLLKASPKRCQPISRFGLSASHDVVKNPFGWVGAVLVEVILGEVLSHGRVHAFGHGHPAPFPALRPMLLVRVNPNEPLCQIHVLPAKPEAPLRRSLRYAQSRQSRRRPAQPFRTAAVCSSGAAEYARPVRKRTRV